MLKYFVNLTKLFLIGQNFSKNFCEYITMENLDYKNENIERKYLENMQDNQFLKVKHSLLELEKMLWN